VCAKSEEEAEEQNTLEKKQQNTREFDVKNMATVINTYNIMDNEK